MKPDDIVTLRIKGYILHYLDDNNEYVEEFIPLHEYHLSKQQAKDLIPQSYTLLSTTRHTKTMQVYYNDLLQIAIAESK
ncbi:TPA: hypothetical protein P6Q16_002334 [Staphylococcus aureus]|uniref:Uncharacterized protein n=1 Tax=Staphylococcus phage SLPW TaxID=1821228 RepID=A0A173G9R3_9CAUD|nr:hypothetical protein BI069_gp02 [Staphylococcus phage SLPW]HDP4613302.1 hypothetical protein [Staphylococcus aureus]ANH49983.1 hypothetical protein [Staphylococcus phage SLPW]HDP4618835.1 hypothetical protein [Staphylococcus aureus]HDP4631772.1 hypothetical protein [Staphylococcus aureus]HDP4660648.1 hypothetical protein [Staphylococcus aureus]